MNYMIRVFFTNSSDTQTYNAGTLELAVKIRDRESKRRFVRKVETSVLLDTWSATGEVFKPIG